MQMSFYEGTAKCFSDNKIMLNGEPLNEVVVNALAKHGMIETIGEGMKPSRGRTPKLYRAVSKAGMVFSIEDKSSNQSPSQSHSQE